MCIATNTDVSFRIYGESGLLMEFGEAISPEINAQVRSVLDSLDSDPLPGIIEVTPAYRSLLIIYDPSQIGLDSLRTMLLQRADQLSGGDLPTPEVTEIPVCYGGDYGPDIQAVSAHNALSVADVIQIHTAPTYPIYMIGFTPGFPFLGGLSERLHTPRLKSPRTRVPAGAVGIANSQTGIYPIESPGGWQLIGQTPLKLFDNRRSDPFLLRAGDSLKFKAISPEEFSQYQVKGDV